MAVTTDTLAVSLNSIGISQAKGVDVPLLRDQVSGTLPKDKATGQAQQSSNNGEESTSTQQSSTRFTASKELTAQQQREVARLQQIDRDVRAHEQAHIAAGHGVVTSGPNYTYTYGPDGKQYATGGEVGIDTAPAHKPQANIDKGIRIQAAALAPRDPSPQDYRVAAVGSHLETTGRNDLAAVEAQQRAEEAAKAQARKEAETTAGQQTQPEAKAAQVKAGNAPEPATEAQVSNTRTQQAESARQLLARTYTPPKEDRAPAAVSVFA
ncbi:MAG: hypothetical protein EKK46_04090 [Rhodocyclaceae bacterium]|nr:MAG: hypothetical protein EKK46_04090 [Rhodocyclaceae bacterium]